MEKSTQFIVHIYISGRVQGVGFRFFTINRAHLHSIRGWVRNLYDGRVEIVAQGTRDNLILFLEDIKKGPPSSYVSDMTETWDETATPRYDDFTVKF